MECERVGIILEEEGNRFKEEALRIFKSDILVLLSSRLLLVFILFYITSLLSGTPYPKSFYRELLTCLYVFFHSFLLERAVGADLHVDRDIS